MVIKQLYILFAKTFYVHGAPCGIVNNAFDNLRRTI